MVLRLLPHVRHAGWLALVGACVAASACSNNPPATPDAFVQATVNVGTHNGACNFTAQQTLVGIGVPTGKLPSTVKDGDTQSGSTQVNVSCTVATSGNGFDVTLNATLEGTTGGSLTITSPAGQGAVTPNGGSGISGVFQSATSGVYRESDCTISYSYQGGSVPDSPPIAAGRIWGHLSCPNASLNGQTTTGPDGGASAVLCDAEADFLFENCGQ